jgi:hypothetical protein
LALPSASHGIRRPGAVAMHGLDGAGIVVQVGILLSVSG